VYNPDQTFHSLSRLVTFAVTFVILILAAQVHSASAQQLPEPAIEFAAGTLLFADDGVVREGFVGGAARFYVLPRLSLGPEIAYIRGENHSHAMLTANATFDLLRPVNGQPRSVTPFVVIGGGLFRTRERFPNREDFSSNEGAFTAGGGVRTLLGRNVIVGAEARVGWELHIRLNGIIGVRFGR
jgi:hypothetical protein